MLSKKDKSRPRHGLISKIYQHIACRSPKMLISIAESSIIGNITLIQILNDQ